ncbi:hypothetical protein [Halothiobacillus sp.]|uniref:hypothetical protein n=1 Tax=Halothiobacillus sp. TaxID=1891311 RepID=UPI0026205292|nr:hypothetical protein [Halothiobacillus sp.]
MGYTSSNHLLTLGLLSLVLFGLVVWLPLESELLFLRKVCTNADLPDQGIDALPLNDESH